MPQVLLNHSEQDRLPAENLHRSLTQRGWNVQGGWQLPAAHRAEEYLEAILPTVGCIVTIWTESSLVDHQVKDIAYEADRLGIALSVVLDDLRLPLALRRVPPLDLASHDLALPESQGLNELVDAAESVLVGTTYPGSATVTDEPSLSVRVARRVLEELRNQDVMQAAIPAPPARFQLGDWDVDVGSNTLTKDETIRKLPPRSMEVLAYLAARSPDTVAVQEVLEDVWRNRMVVDSVVHKCVREIRVALEDDYRQPLYIETYPKRGYRIIAKVA